MSQNNPNGQKFSPRVIVKDLLSSSTMCLEFKMFYINVYVLSSYNVYSNCFECFESKSPSNVDSFNLIPSFTITKLASSSQFHFTKTCAFTYKGVLQSSYKTLIIMLGQTYPNIHMDLYSNLYFNKTMIEESSKGICGNILHCI